MINGSIYLQWHYMIFIAPATAAAFLLLLSSLRLGGHRGGHSGHRGHASHGGVRHHGGVKHGHRGQSTKRSRNSEPAPLPGSWAASVLLALFGIGRAPLTIVVEIFALCWGFTGIWANRLLIPADVVPTLARLLPSLGIALGCGLVGSRLSAELLARLLPKDETAVVSRNGLFGLTGRVAYTVTESGGRIHIYDENGTLHDETCRVAAGCSEIPKGRYARIIDLDESENLIVEEAPEPIKLR